MNKQGMLLDWIKQQPYVTSYQVKRYGQSIYCMDPDKRCREWTTAGVLVHLSDEEKEKVGIKKKFVVWRVARPEQQLELKVA